MASAHGFALGAIFILGQGASGFPGKTAPARRLGVRVPEPSPWAPYPSAESTLSGKQEPGRPTLSYLELWRGSPFDI